MVNRLIGALLAIVIGLALLPVVGDFVDGLTGVGMQYADTTVGTLINLLPILYVVIVVVGTIAYIATRKD